ncbi:hypothetical protein [Paenibacillus sp. Soil724D2]|uniref:hypothetical protein n=1 Tax=Paenibacillus sp. (strain Soil724D2) TaxID=1736392 RepID=UPI000714F252|nr:hypothetical protein [Paenibacillus sp. Soil724D2]KRE51337.1 hypothetical protein ASG85_17555 [Paenibacillus sp. Soil724D2]
MFKRLQSFIQRHTEKIVAIVILLFLVTLFIWHYPIRKIPNEPVVTAPASQEPLVTPTIPPVKTADFEILACPADFDIYPSTTQNSGFTAVKMPITKSLTSVRHVSTGHLLDQAGYGMEFGTSYALAEDGSVYRWGNLSFEAGIHPSGFPQKVAGAPTSIKQLDGRFALTHQGEVWDLGMGETPKPVQELKGAIGIAQAFDSSVLGWYPNGVVRLYETWGSDGKPSTKKWELQGELTEIYASPYIALGLRKDGTLVHLQDNSFQNPTNSLQNIVLPNEEKPTKIETTMSYSTKAYIQSDRQKWYMINQDNQLVDATVPDSTIQPTATQHYTVALQKNGSVLAWGDLQSLLGPDYQSVTPEKAIRLDGLSNVAKLAVGSDHVLALTTDRQLLSLGSNMYGQLGRSSVYTAVPIAIGQWPGLDELYPSYESYIAIKDGDAWLWKTDDTPKPLLLGQKISKALNSHTLLTSNGHLLFLDPDGSKTCRMLQTPEPIVDVSHTWNGFLMVLRGGRTLYAQGIEGNSGPLKVSDFILNPRPKGVVTRVFGSPSAFALTDQGELYFAPKMVKGAFSPDMVPAQAGTSFRQFSPIDYVFNDGSRFVALALDEQNKVHELTLKQTEGSSETNIFTVEIKKTDQKAQQLTGGAYIDSQGIIHDTNLIADNHVSLPGSSKLATSSSYYHFPIEGRAYFFHHFVTQDGTIYWLGDRPFTRQESRAGAVVIP